MVVSPVFSVLHFRTRRFAVRALTSHEHDQVVIRFSTYELDVRAGELRKQGVRIKLQEQPFRILEMLLANPGQVVTREESSTRAAS
jgi:DNA-binding response OmpR family regulator